MTERGGTWATYARLQGIGRPYRGLLLLAFAFMGVEALGAAGFSYSMKPLIDETIVAQEPEAGILVPLAIIGLFVVRGIAGYIADMAAAKAGRSIARDLRVMVLGKYLRLPVQRFDSEPVPSMLNRLGSDSDLVALAAVDALKVMVQQSLQVVAMLGMMFWYSWKVTLAVLLLAPPLAWVMDRVGRRYRRIGHRIQESNAQLMQLADQSLGNHQDVRAYGAQAGEGERYAAQAQDVLRLSMKVESTRSASSALVQLMGSVGLAALAFMAGREAAAGRLTAGDFVGLMVAMMAIIPAIKQLTNVQGMLQRGIASAERLFEVLDTPDERDDGTVALARARGEIEFRDVTVAYPGQAAPALRDASFSARPGTVTAIVGRSGSGKSTLVKLLPRFYEPQQGTILLDGRPLSDYRLADLRRQIAIVGQHVLLVDGTVADNVAYGELSASSGEARRAAIEGANAAEFVDRMPDGEQARLGVRGGRLSGGQRQRLAIARAMLKDAPVLILDEATAALDTESERLVQDALERLMPDRTTLVIAHRLSTIEHADQVLVLDQGRIVERGTHAELLAHGGLYAHLHRMQFREA